MSNQQQQQQQQQQFQQHMQVGSSGLTRYRSAPSSYFASLLDSPGGDGGFEADDLEQIFNPRASTPETHRIVSRFMSGGNDTAVQENFSSSMNLPSQSQFNSQFLPKNEPQVMDRPQQQSNDYPSSSQMIYQSHHQNPEDTSLNRQSWGSFNSNSGVPIKMGGGGGHSTLIRHSSSPAGLFANINIENVRGMGNFGGGNNADAAIAEASFSSANRIQSTQMHSLDPISESGNNNNKGIGQNIVPAEEHGGNDGDYIPGFPVNSWDDSSILPDNFLNGLLDNDAKRFSNANALDEENNEGGNRPATLLAHHLSLPTSSAELSAMLQDSVPCKIRAKRGFATHPRSIAERVRRTKISERIRKLQELVPNMEKQTNTSDMLDLAVDYIRDLQRQVQTLSDNREKCSCSAKQRS